MDRRTRRSPARFLAPLALIAVVVAFMAVISGSGGNGGSSTGTTTTSSTATTRTTRKATAKKSKAAATPGSSAARVYTIQVGDTLGGIANKTGVSLDRITTLNPNVDPHALVLGQKIKLR